MTDAQPAVSPHPTEPPDWRAVADAALGWQLPGEADLLHDAAVHALRETGLPLLEIGAYAGKTAINLGAAAQSFDQVVYSLDWHRGSPEMTPGRECHHPEMLDTEGQFDSLPHFRRNVRRAGVERSVIAVVGDSHRVAATWRTKVGLLFIDADHTPEGVRADYLDYTGHVARGGLLALHDHPVIAGEVARLAQRTGGYKPWGEVGSLMILEKTG